MDRLARIRARKHAFALTTMLVGSTAVLGANIFMNQYTRPVKTESVEEGTSMEVVKKKKKPRERQMEQQRRSRPDPTPQRRAPAPAIDSAISSVDIAMPGFDSSQLGQVSDQVLGVNEKNQIMDEASVDSPPKPVERVAPDEYPADARKRGIKGFVTMNLLIGASGEVERVKVLQAEPSGVFEEVALATIRKWRFEPAVYEQNPVRAWAKQTIRFELN